MIRRLRRNRGQGGFVLLAVLVVAMMTSLVVVSLMFRVRAEEATHAAAAVGEQSRAVAMSGIAQAMQIVYDNAHADQVWRDNPDSFEQQLVVDDGADRWYFTIYAAPAEQGEPPRFGLSDEAGKLNLHRADAESIADLPDVSLAVAERIKDYIGSASAESGAGAQGPASLDPSAVSTETDEGTSDRESMFDPEESILDDPESDSLQDGRLFDDRRSTSEAGADGSSSSSSSGDSGDAGNGGGASGEAFSLPGSTGAGATDLGGMVGLDHLLGVEDVDLAMLYGGGQGEGFGAEADLAMEEQAARSISTTRLPATNADRLERPGLRDRATLMSYEPNVDQQGRPRINLTDPDASLEELDFSDELLELIEDRRESESSFSHVAELLLPDSASSEDEEDEDNDDEESDDEESDDDADDDGALDGDSLLSRPSTSEAAGGRRPGSSSSSSSPTEEAAWDFDYDELRQLLDRCTATDEQELRGRVNLNTASADVLAALPGVDESLAETIVSNRAGLSEEERASIVWLLQEEHVSLESFVSLAPHLTTRSYQFHVQVLAYAMPSQRYRVMEAVIDTAGEKPRLVYLRDLTRLGPPLPMEDNADSSGSLARLSP